MITLGSTTYELSDPIVLLALGGAVVLLLVVILLIVSFVFVLFVVFLTDLLNPIH